MAVNTGFDTKVYIGGVKLTATDTAAEFAALTWVEIGKVTGVGKFGPRYTPVTFKPLSGPEQTLKGGLKLGGISLVCGYDAFDTGQIAIRAANDVKFEYAFRLEYADKLDANDTNSITYFHGVVLSAEDDVSDSDNVIGQTIDVGISSNFIRVPAAVVA